MKKIILSLITVLATVAVTNAQNVDVTITNRTGCDIRFDAFGVDAACTVTGAVTTGTTLTPSGILMITEPIAGGTTAFKIQNAVIVGGPVVAIAPDFYTDGTPVCTGGAVSAATAIIRPCNGGNVVTATVTGAFPNFAVDFN